MIDPGAGRLDAISLEIYWNRLLAICDEAVTGLVRTAFSTIVRESRDCVSVILDVDGDLIAENRGSVPAFVGCLSPCMKDLLRCFPLETWKPGDIVMTNDPWMGTGHRPDIVMVAPVFHDGRIVAFSGNVAHAADIGGVVWAADCHTVHEEGIGIPPLKLSKAGELNEDILSTIRYNVRVPDMVVGDLFAQMSALEISGARLADFMAETGMEDLRVVGAPIQDLGEKAMRRAIAELPNGAYAGVTYLDGYDRPLKIYAAITVQDDEIDVDFTGTSDQVDDGGINVPYNYTQAYTTYPLKCLLDPHTTRTSGSFRPITVRAPEGCILNCRYPAAVNARTLTGDTICNVVFMALSDVLPQRVIAESGTTPPLRIFVSGTGLDEVPFTFHLFANGGMGARPTADGLHCTPYPTNIQCASMEVMESVAPLLVWKKELAPDSGGPGRYMGGLGQDMTVEVISDKPVTLSVISEKWDFPPLGRAGGMAARANRAEKVMGEGPLPRKGRTQLLPGDVINLSFAGGGGYGPPAERDPARVVEDLRDGLISEARARNVFGVDVNTSVDDRR